VDKQPSGKLILPTDRKPLIFRISEVELDGTFQITWSDKVFAVKFASLINKNVLQVRVNWINSDIVLGRKPAPTYIVQVTDSTDSLIRFKLLFDDPSSVSRGIAPD
jgi:hypothetical protein